VLNCGYFWPAAVRRTTARARIGSSGPEPDAQVPEQLLRETIAIGRRFSDPDIEFDALAYLGGVFMMTDRIEEGLALCDEGLAVACAGELTDLATLDAIFCGFFWACELVNDIPRADQWMRAAAELLERRHVVAFCRAHYGGILIAASPRRLTPPAWRERCWP
jgi:hypothetical protein